MSSAVIALAVAVGLLTFAVITMALTHYRERIEWAGERRALVDRAIAQHTGEVIALDRQAARKNGQAQPAPVERPHPVGL